MSCSSSGETDCINRASGNCHSVLVAVTCADWDWTNCTRLRQPTLPLSIRINTGSLCRNVSILNYKRDKDNVS